MNQYPSRSVRTGRWKYIRNLDSAAEHHTPIDRGQTVDGNQFWTSWVDTAKTDKRAAAIVDRYFHRPAEELYDLQSDPAEQQNLSANPHDEDVLAELRGKVDRWMKQQGDVGLATEHAVAEEFLHPSEKNHGKESQAVNKKRK